MVLAPGSTAAAPASTAPPMTDAPVTAYRAALARVQSADAADEARSFDPSGAAPRTAFTPRRPKRNVTIPYTSEPFMPGPLSITAQLLADELQDEGVALAVIENAPFAEAEGDTIPGWMRSRQATLRIIGASIAELRANGWTLEVENVTAPDPRLPKNAERAVIAVLVSMPDAGALGPAAA